MDIRIKTPIDAPADEVWGILAHRFGDVSEWASGVKTSHVVGPEEAPPDLVLAPQAPVAGRFTDAGLELREFFVEFDEEAQRFTFEAVGLPRIFRLSRNTTTVEATGTDSSTVVFDIHTEMRGPFVVIQPYLKRRLAAGLKHVQEDLKAYVESGAVSAASPA